MNALNRRTLIRLAAASAATSSPLAWAQASGWPTKPVTMVVPFAAGGGTDAFGRPLSAQFAKQTGQNLIIENRGGAGGTLGASVASKAANDGYTLFMGAVHHTIAPSMYKRLDYDLEKDFVPLVLAATVPQVVVVNPRNIPSPDFKSFLELVRKSPGRFNYGSAGAGTTHHLAGEFFNSMAKTKLNHIPYRGAGPLMQDLLAGHVPMAFDGLGTSGPQIASGKLRGLAITAPKRVPALPDVPTSAEAGLPGFEFSTWYGILARKGTPKEVIDRMIKEVKIAMALPAIQAAWERNGSIVPDVSGAEFGKIISADVARWHKVVAESGIKVEQ